MRKWFNILKDKNMLFDFINLILGIVGFISLIIYILVPGLGYLHIAILVALISASNGYRYMQTGKKKSIGKSHILFGVAIVVYAIILKFFV